MSYKKLGKYIKLIDNRNKDLSDAPLLGVSVQKRFITSIANTIGSDMSKYKLIEKNNFTYIADTSRRGDKIGIALLKDFDKAMISQAYTSFKIIDENELSPDYLMMWFSRPEFDRYARYHSIGSVREVFDWKDMSEVELPIPAIEEQRQIVAQYQSIANKIKVNEQICEKLEATAQALYKHWFVDFEFPNEAGKPYKSSGGQMMWNEDLGKEIPEGWEVGDLGNYIESFSKSHNFKKSKLIFFNTSDILNGEFLHSDYMSVDDMPGQAKKSIKKDDILYSEIRPNNRRFALVRFEADDYVVSTKLMVLRKTNNEIGLYRLYYYLISDETIKDFQDSAEGRSGTFPQITFEEDLKYRKFIKGNDSTEIQIDKIFSATYRKVYNLKDQNIKLTHFRNLLLSRLAVGEEVGA